MSYVDCNQMSFEEYYNIILSKMMELEKKQQETDSKIDKCISSINAKLDEGMGNTNAKHEELIRRLDSLQNENPQPTPVDTSIRSTEEQKNNLMPSDPQRKQDRLDEHGVSINGQETYFEGQVSSDSSVLSESTPVDTSTHSTEEQKNNLMPSDPQRKQDRLDEHGVSINGQEKYFEGQVSSNSSVLSALQENLSKLRSDFSEQLSNMSDIFTKGIKEIMRILENINNSLEQWSQGKEESKSSKNKTEDLFFGFLNPKRKWQLEFFTKEQNAAHICEQFKKKMLPKEWSMGKCEDPSAKLQETILLVFCMDITRNNVESTLQCVNRSNYIILVSVHFGNACTVQSPKTTLEPKYKYVKHVIDIIHEHDNGFYDCETNNEAKKALKKILK